MAAGMSSAGSGTGASVPPAPVPSGDSVAAGEPTAVGGGASPAALTGVGDGVVATPPADEVATDADPVGAAINSQLSGRFGGGQGVRLDTSRPSQTPCRRMKHTPLGREHFQNHGDRGPTRVCAILHKRGPTT